MHALVGSVTLVRRAVCHTAKRNLSRFACGVTAVRPFSLCFKPEQAVIQTTMLPAANVMVRSKNDGAIIPCSLFCFHWRMLLGL